MQSDYAVTYLGGPVLTFYLDPPKSRVIDGDGREQSRRGGYCMYVNKYKYMVRLLAMQEESISEQGD